MVNKRVEIQLKVDSAYPEDQGRGLIRLDPDSMLRLRVSPGEIVNVQGGRRTVGKVWRQKVEDWNLGKVRLDNYIRNNAESPAGDLVTVSKIPKEIKAVKVLLAPPESLPRQIPINFSATEQLLTDYPAVVGDSVPIPVGAPFMPQQIVPFVIEEMEPADAVMISRDTQIDFSDTPAEGFEGFPLVSYEDIGGLKKELQKVRETIELPLRHPELFARLGIEPPKGVLLYGPPGTGKTLIAKAVASESGAHFISIAGPEVISKYYGESEQRLREIFDEAEEHAPSVIFIDELDSIAPKREDVTGEVERRVVAQLLTMMDGLEERGQVVVIGATNRVGAIDPALRRPGRFDREIEIGVPDEDDRLEVLRIHTRGMPIGDDTALQEKRAAVDASARKRQVMEEEYLELQRLFSENAGSIHEYTQKSAATKAELLALDIIITSLEQICAEARDDKSEDHVGVSEDEAELGRERFEQAKLQDRLGKEEEILKKLDAGAEQIKSDIDLKTEEIRLTVEAEVGLEEAVRPVEEDFTAEKEKILRIFSAKTTGFVGADLAALAREAAIRALRRHLPDIDLNEDAIPEDVLKTIQVSSDDMMAAFRETSPSAMREIFLEVPRVRWDEVGGLTSEKEEVRETVEYPLTQPEKFEALGIEPPRGVLLYGPPGTGKTLIAKAVANESGANFIPIRGPQLLSKWVGESERAVRDIFRKARQVAPSIIFFDELDAFAPARGGSEVQAIENVINQILTELDGLEEMHGVMVMGATNRPDRIDPALLRTGRFDRLVYIGEPDEKGRAEILAVHMRMIPIEGSEFNGAAEALSHLGDEAIDALVRDAPKRILTLSDLPAIPEKEGESGGESPLTTKERLNAFTVALQSHNKRFADPAREALIATLAEKTTGYVGSDLALLCREAGMAALRSNDTTVGERHFNEGLKKVHPMMNDRVREHYGRIRNYFKGGLAPEVQPPEYQ